MNHVVVNAWPEADPAIIAPRPEHEELRDVVRSLLARAAGHEAVRAAAEGEKGYSADLWDRLNRDLEVSSMVVPEELGGAGFGVRELAVVLEETGAALLPEPVLFSSVLAAHALASADDPKVVGEELTKVERGELVGTVSLAEPDVAVENGRATGVLPRVVAGAESDLVVFRSAAGIHLVRRDRHGVDATPLEVVDLTRRQADVRLDEVAVATIVGPENAAQAWSRLDRVATIAAAAEHVGVIRHQLDTTVRYVQHREQFGQAIGSFQAIKHRLADVLVDLERSRSAVTYAAALFDLDPDSELAAEIAGAVTTDAVVRVVHEVVHLHGGIGFTWEHPAHYYVRRALGDEGIFGSARSHRARIAALVGV